jgi:2-polyprenyl-3-methyl-5-hydroxy-6-metoxy-1,4-benzoquinol methylase
MDEQTIRLAYRLILGREPENDLVVKEMATHLCSYDDVRDKFINSSEFQSSRSDLKSFIAEGYNMPAREIETTTSDQALELIFERIRAQWRALGESEPYWSVITDDAFKEKNFESNARQFFDSGRSVASLVDTFAQRSEMTISGGVCLELGCGVGRVTRFLAEKFDKVIAVDVSEGNLARCSDYIESSGVANVETVLIHSPRDLVHLPTFDFLFSVIVLQHNPPPVQRFVLDALLAKAKAGASCLFQTPTHIPGYRFVVSDYLDTASPIMEMHCLPMPAVFDVLHKHGFGVREVLMDNWTGGYGSHTFFASKRR